MARRTRCNWRAANVQLNWRSEQQPVDEAAALQFLSSPLAHSAQITLPPPVTPPSAPSHTASPSVPLSVHALSARWDASGASLVASYCETTVGHPVRFDLLYGTDLFYARTAVDDVLRFALPLLADSGVLMLAHTPRIAQLHDELRSACKQRSLTLRYLNTATSISRAEEVERGWTQVEIALITHTAPTAAVDELTQSDDWQWAMFESEGRVERQQADEERMDADDSVAFSALGISADDL